MTYQITEEQLPNLLQTIRSRDLDLPFVSDFGCFNNNSQANIKRWGTRHYKAVLETFTQQVPKNICSFSYIVGERTKQLWIPPWKMMDFFITQEVFVPYHSFIRRVISELQDKDQPVQISSSFVYQLFGFLILAVHNTLQGRNGFQIQDDRIIIVGDFEYKKFRNCDREYEVNGLGPMSNALRNFVLQLMNIDASDLDQVSSSPTIAKHLFSQEMYRQMFQENYAAVNKLEEGIQAMEQLIEKKNNGQTEMKAVLNETLFGSEKHLNNEEAQKINDAVETFVQNAAGYRSVRAGRSWLAQRIFDLEHHLQRTFERNLREQGAVVISHIYDGCIVHGHIDEKTLQSCIIKTEEETGIKMEWAIKKTWSKRT